MDHQEEVRQKEQEITDAKTYSNELLAAIEGLN